MLRHYHHTAEFFREKRPIAYMAGLSQGSSYTQSRAVGGTGTVKKTTIPTSKALAAAASAPPTTTQNIVKIGESARGVRDASGAVTNYVGGKVTGVTPAPSAQPSSEIKFGSDLLKAINEQPATSPFNIKAAQKNPSVQAQVKALTPSGTGRINFNVNPSATGSQSVISSSVTPDPFQVNTASKVNVSPGITKIGEGARGVRSADGTITEYVGGKVTNVLPGDLQDEEEEQPQEEPISNDIAGIQNQILSLVQPSSEEQAVQAQLDQELSALNQGLVEVEDRPVALPFITGMSSSLERRSSARTSPLEAKLSRLQEARLGKLQAMQTQLGFKNDELTRQFQKSQSDFSNKVALATKGLRYDPAKDKFYKDESLSAPEDQKEITNLEQGLRKEYTTSAKDFETVRDAYGRIQAAAADKTGSGDLALLFSYMKVLDPNSVVRESEFDNAAAAMGYVQKALNIPSQIINGTRLTDAGRAQFLNSAQNLYSAQVAQQKQRAETYTQIAKNAGLNPANVVIDIGLAPGIGSNAGTGGNAFTGGEIGTSSKGGDFQNAEAKVSAIILDIQDGYSMNQIMDYYGLTQDQYLAITQQL